MRSETCALIAQVIPVFLVVFGVRGSFLQYVARLPRNDLPSRTRLPWFKQDKWQWLFLILIFLAAEVAFVMASDGIFVMAPLAGYGVFGLVLLFAFLELTLPAFGRHRPGSHENSKADVP